MRLLSSISFTTKWIFLAALLGDLKVEGLKLAYDEIVPTDYNEINLPPIILMHAIITWRKDWRYVAPVLAKNTGRKVFCIDARNHGESPWTNNFSFQEMADDLDEFLVDHGIDKAIIVGHSLGGKTAIMFALQKPEKVEKLIVEDMRVKDITPEQYEKISSLLKMIDGFLPELTVGQSEKEDKDYLQRFGRSFFKRVFGVRNIDFEMLPLKRNVDGYTWMANANMLKNDENLFQKLNPRLSGKYLGEALFIYGTRSMFEVRKDDVILKFFPQAKLLEIPGWHLLHYESQERYITEVSNFINGKKTDIPDVV